MDEPLARPPKTDPILGVYGKLPGAEDPGANQDPLPAHGPPHRSAVPSRPRSYMSSRRVWAETFPSLPRSRSSCRTCPSAGEAVQANAAASIRKRIRGMLGPWPTRLAVRPVGRAPLTVSIRG